MAKSYNSNNVIHITCSRHPDTYDCPDKRGNTISYPSGGSHGNSDWWSC